MEITEEKLGMAKKLSRLVSWAMILVSASATIYYFLTGDSVMMGIYMCLVWIVLLHLKE